MLLPRPSPANTEHHVFKNFLGKSKSQEHYSCSVSFVSQLAAQTDHLQNFKNSIKVTRFQVKLSYLPSGVNS